MDAGREIAGCLSLRETCHVAPVLRTLEVAERRVAEAEGPGKTSSTNHNLRPQPPSLDVLKATR